MNDTKQTSEGAGRGIGIDAIVGVTAGLLYGLNKVNSSDQRAGTAYGTCMSQRGF